MELTKDEKKVIITALKKHLEEVEKTEKFRYQNIKMIEGQMKYVDFVKNLLTKLK